MLLYSISSFLYLGVTRKSPKSQTLSEISGFQNFVKSRFSVTLTSKNCYNSLDFEDTGLKICLILIVEHIIFYNLGSLTSLGQSFVKLASKGRIIGFFQSSSSYSEYLQPKIIRCTFDRLGKLHFVFSCFKRNQPDIMKRPLFVSVTLMIKIVEPAWFLFQC